MKHLSLLSTLLIGLLIAGCGEKAKDEGKPTGNPGQSGVTLPGTSPIDPNTAQQIPAKEVLGSRVERFVRYQPEDEVANYINSPEELDAFIGKSSAAMRRQIGDLTPETPNYGTVVVGVNANNQYRIWYSFPNGEPSNAFKNAMHAAIAEVPLLKVKKEVVVFGIALTLWGYKETPAQAAQVILPKEWQEAGKTFSSPQTATKLAQIAWDKAGA